MPSFNRFSSGVLLAVFLSSLGAVQADPALTLRILGANSVENVDNFNVTVQLKNTGTEALELYNEPRGLLSKAPTDSFKILKANDDSAASFDGVLAKYNFASATSFTNLGVGESVDVTHNLAQAYSFASGGAYNVVPSNTRFFYKGEDGQPVPIDATVERTHTAKLIGSLVSRHVQKRQEHAAKYKKRALEAQALGKRATQFANCTPDQEQAIQESVYVASLYVAQAEKYLTLNTETTDRYGTWFGEYSADNHQTALSHFAAIRKSDVKTYTFDCACEESSDTYAYVYPSEFGHIYLCNQYMLAAVSGTDSKAGTIVHESTHFTANGGTRDLAYGQVRAQALAAANATAAVNNADSHEYFAENTPYRP
ncbi:Peptidyl-Lys metalloendopeptidase Short=MEP; AltName: Full=GfMEP; Flags: Precursor [Serendipita indica DSM 11827]|uniref:Related to deuterolysin M35 metalloprotease-Laccaria bicolor n=1 Tax=Serendipita indica (strain DSM 11827) TaxID=1109443 RepID=G4TVQ7_SERID|nr:Peptidyl-Lys metalloendopeptidase Short=MEP; AltName: Full=GfMEP; Flags: Precursor [Serendipita indica DSM 11827]CCA75400.1 related to deuterolysin M35 metalloprotease-Laccaria bicolor [Serendipita indica DSM 11827]